MLARGLRDTLLSLLALLELLGSPGALPAQPRLPAWVPRSVAGRQRVLRRHEEARQRLEQRLGPYRRKQKLSKKDRETMKRLKVSVTDAEAALGWDKGGTYRPLYNVPLVQATDAPLTLAWDVLGRNNDDGLLKPMREKTKEQLGRPLEGVLVDGAFVSVGEVVWCEGERITVFAPPPKTEAAKAEGEKAEGEDCRACPRRQDCTSNQRGGWSSATRARRPWSVSSSAWPSQPASSSIS